MAIEVRLYPVETDGNYTVGPSPAVEIIHAFLQPASNSLDLLGGADSYLQRERLFVDADPVVEEPPAPPGEITFVGGQAIGTVGRTADWPATTFALTGGSDSTPQAGDFVIIQYGIGTPFGRSFTPSIVSPTDYTPGTALNNENANFRSNNLFLYKFMGETPDTTVTFGPTGNGADGGGVVILVFRGVDPADPLGSITPTTMTGSGTGAGQNKPNPAPILPTATGSWVITFGMQTLSTSVAFTQPAAGLDAGAFFEAIGQDTSADVAVGGGYYSGWTSGTHDIDIFGGGSNNANATQNCYTIVLKPAAGGGGGDPPGQPKAYNGSTFAPKPAKAWNGSAWVEKPAKTWTGSAWVLA